MVKEWGSRRVSSALEVAIILEQLPAAEPEEWLKDAGLDVAPPIWGGAGATVRAAYVVAQGYRVVSWDDYGIAFLQRNSVIYRTWELIELERESMSLAANSEF